MSRTLQFRRLGTATLANTTGANGELIINSTTKTLTVHDGVTPGGFVVTGNTSSSVDQFARNTANTAISSITVLQGVDATQNTNITNATNLAQSAYNYANTIVSDTQTDPVARATANSAAANTVIIQGVNLTQNTNITNATNLAQAAYNYANTINTTNVDQFARNTANTATNNITIIQGVNNSQNTNITNATTLAQNAYNNSNTKFSSSGGQITGNVIIVGDLDVTDNTVVTNAIEANNVIIDGSLKTGLAARTSVVLPHLIAQFASNSATYVQTNSQNINPEGSADWVVTADNGTDTDFYLDLGLHGSQAFDKILTPYDGYLFVQGSTIGQAGGNLIIGTTSDFPGLETMFVAGGYESNNRVMRIGTYGANIIGDLTVTGNIIGPTINAISGGGVTGNISIAATNSAINFVANSSGDGNGYSTIELRPDSNASSDQYLIIDPTAPGHIHIRAGGTQDSSGAELFLGGENSYVKVGAGLNPPVTIKANTYSWDFDVNGDLAAPGKIYLNNGNENVLTFDQFGIRANTQMSLSAENFATGNNSTILFDKNGSGIVFRLEDTTPVSKNWSFYQNSLVFPDSSTQTGAAISIVELKALVANCATYGDFQTAIANL